MTGKNDLLSAAILVLGHSIQINNNNLMPNNNVSIVKYDGNYSEKNSSRSYDVLSDKINGSLYGNCILVEVYNDKIAVKLPYREKFITFENLITETSKFIFYCMSGINYSLDMPDSPVMEYSLTHELTTLIEKFTSPELTYVLTKSNWQGLELLPSVVFAAAPTEKWAPQVQQNLSGLFFKIHSQLLNGGKDLSNSVWNSLMLGYNFPPTFNITIDNNDILKLKKIIMEQGEVKEKALDAIFMKIFDNYKPLHISKQNVQTLTNFLEPLKSITPTFGFKNNLTFKSNLSTLLFLLSKNEKYIHAPASATKKKDFFHVVEELQQAGVGSVILLRMKTIYKILFK